MTASDHHLLDDGLDLIPGGLQGSQDVFVLRAV